MKHDSSMKITLSITKEEKETFDELCDLETHGPSDQFRHMMKFYIKNKDKVK